MTVKTKQPAHTINTGNSNGYMIRLEVLKMAKEMAEQDYYSRRDSLRQAWETQVDYARQRAADNNQMIDLPKEPVYPAFPSAEYIKQTATELYQFICTK